MSIDTDQATVEAWLAAGTWVEFAESVGGPPCLGCIWHPDDVPHYSPPLDWLADQKCETCGGTGEQHFQVQHPHGDYVVPCPDCNGTGLRRHPVTVPCPGPPHHGFYGPGKDACSGRITVAWATVEWGPLAVVDAADEPRPVQGEFDRDFITLRHHRAWRDGQIVKEHPVLVRFTANRRGEGATVTLPPDIDPATLVGQWARGGMIGAAS